MSERVLAEAVCLAQGGLQVAVPGGPGLPACLAPLRSQSRQCPLPGPSIAPRFAKQDLTRALELDPSDLLSYTRRAHAFRRMGEYEAAVGDYTKVRG